MIYKAKVVQGPPYNGYYPVDPNTVEPVHSATSNGDGTYSTKNGSETEDPMASEAEAIGTYTDPDPPHAGDEEIYPVCYEKK